MPRGRVKWFDDSKGFGYIEQEDGQEVFVHYTVIEGERFKSLRPGEEVECEVVGGEKGLRAIKVSRI